MNIIYKCEFGSVIYGTSVPTSDKDYKSIFLPDAKDILLQRVPSNISNNTKQVKGAKNTKDDIDDQSISLQEYMKLLLEGQTPALDMLFCPEHLIIQDSDIMREIRANKDKFLHKGVSQFVGYVRTQANKYGIKGSRMGELKQAIEFFKLSSIQSLPISSLTLLSLVEGKEHTSIVKIFDTAKQQDIFAIEVCNRKFTFNTKISYVLENLEKIYEAYGHRAKQAEMNEGVDWKALYHAIRVSREAEELLLTGNITFPRPEKDLLLQIRKGELPYQKVAELVEEGLVRVESAVAKSNLRDKPDYEWAEDFVANIYFQVVKNGSYELTDGWMQAPVFDEQWLFNKTKKFGW